MNVPHNALYQNYINGSAPLNKMASRAKIEISLTDISFITTGPAEQNDHNAKIELSLNDISLTTSV